MVKKIMTGLAISVGAGLAFTVTNRAAAKRGLWPGTQGQGTLTPIDIRVHGASPRNEQLAERARLSENAAAQLCDESEELMALTTSPERSAELAEIRVMIESLEQRTAEMMSVVNQRIDDLQNHLPRFIDVKVTSRIREVEERLRTEFQDEQSKTLDAFLQTLDQKILPRITLLEDAVGAQGAEIGRIHQRLEKTDSSLERVLDRIEKVVDSIATSPIPNYPNSPVMEIHQKAVA
jgi:hypothetical protein